VFPRNTFARRRIGRFLRHSYTRVPVIDVLDSGQIVGLAAIDQFNRPDTTAGLGQLDADHGWAPVAGSAWGITGGQAYVAFATITQNSLTYVDTDISTEFTVQARVWPGASYSAGLIAHFDPPSGSYVYATVYGTQLNLGMVIGINHTLFAAAAVSWTPGDLLSIELNGTSVRVLQNGFERIGPTLVTAFSTSTVQGMIVEGGPGNPLSARFDNFQVLGVPDPDEAAGLDVYNDPVMTYGNPVMNQPCLFHIGAPTDAMDRTDHGTLTVSRPTLFVLYSDPLRVGDEVRQVRDTEGYIYVDRAIVEDKSEAAPGGARVYQAFGLRQIQSPPA
jgi:hypothetical protein